MYRYRESNLVELLSRYNTCVAPQTSQVRSRNQFPFNYGVLLGTSLNHYQNVNTNASGDYGHNISPNVGVFMGFSIGRIAEVEWQLLYNYSSGQLHKGVNPMYGEERYHFQIHYLTSPLLVRFFLFDKLYLSPGLVLNKAISQSGSEFVYVKDYPFIADPNTFSVGYMAGLGTRFRLLGKTTSLEGRYQVSDLRRAYYPEASLSSVQLLLRMNLAKPAQ